MTVPGDPRKCTGCGAEVWFVGHVCRNQPAPISFPSEAVFQSAVIKAAKALGCMVYHPSNPKRDARGFPDLVIVGGGGTIFRELKTDTGRIRPEQNEWIARLAESGADVAIWRPADWPHHIHQQLKEIR